MVRCFAAFAHPANVLAARCSRLQAYSKTQSSVHTFWNRVGACCRQSVLSKEMKLGLSMPALNTPFFTVLVDAAMEQAKSGGGSVVQTTNANRDASQQVTDLRSLINVGANTILAGVVNCAAISPPSTILRARTFLLSS